MSSLSPLKLVATLLICLAIPVSAQTEQSVDLDKMKEEFLGNLRREIEPESRQYILELKKLERKFAQAGDFQAAIAARDERIAVEKFLGSPTKPTPAPDPEPEPEPTPAIVVAESKDDRADLIAELAKDLAIASATVSEGAEINREKLKMDSSGASASWLSEGLEPGGYEIVVHYNATADTEARVGEGFFYLTADLPATKGRKPVSKSLGTLKVTEDSESITLSNTGSEEKSGLVIHSVQLISAKEWAARRRSTK